MKAYLALPLIALLTVQCTNSAENQDIQVCRLTEEDLPPVKELVIEKIDLPDDCIESYNYVYNDSILVSFHYKWPHPYYLSIMKMGTWEVIGEYFRRGNGPNELVSPYNKFSQNKVYIDDIGKTQIIIFDVDSAVSKGMQYMPQAHDYFHFFPTTWGQIDDSTTVSYNPSYFRSKVYNSPDSIREFMLADLNNKPYEKYSEIWDVSLSDVGGAVIATNIKKRRFIAGYHAKPTYKLYDNKLNLLKQIDGPEPDDAEMEWTMDGSSIDYKKGQTCLYNATCTATENYAIFRNNKFYKRDYDEFSYYGKDTYQLYFMNWDGDIVARYKKKGLVIKALSFSEAAQTLYLTALDEDDETALYKAKIELP